MDVIKHSIDIIQKQEILDISKMCENWRRYKGIKIMFRSKLSWDFRSF